jgi:hypothetical protein
MKVVLLAFVIAGASLYAQDPGSMAVQQANQPAMPAGLEAAQQAQQDIFTTGQATLQAMQPMQLASVQPGRYALNIPPWHSWRVIEAGPLGFSVRPGLV